MKQQVTARIEADPRLERHINLATAVVEPHGPSFLDEGRVEMLGSHQLEDGGLEVGVGEDAPRPDAAAVDDHARRPPAAVDLNLFDEAADPPLDTVFHQ